MKTMTTLTWKQLVAPQADPWSRPALFGFSRAVWLRALMMVAVVYVFTECFNNMGSFFGLAWIKYTGGFCLWLWYAIGLWPRNGQKRPVSLAAAFIILFLLSTIFSLAINSNDNIVFDLALKYVWYFEDPGAVWFALGHN